MNAINNFNLAAILACVLFFIGTHAFEIDRIRGADFRNLNVDPADVEVTSEAEDEALNTVAVNILQMLRSQHGGPDVIAYDKSLKDLAKFCALLYRLQTPKKDLPITNQFESFDSHCMEVGGGNEIIFHTEVPPSNSLGVANVLQTVYSKGEEGYTKFAEPTFDDINKYSTFTQLLWRESTRVGCACDPTPDVKKGTEDPPAPTDLYICSCIFSPPGNVRHGYSQAGLADYVSNVRPRGSKA